jgi:phosphonate transport system substrate-binding protein
MRNPLIERSIRSGFSSWATGRCLPTLLLLVAALAAQGTAAAPDRLILGVHPYLAALELKVRFQPLARYLERHLQIPVSIRIGRDYQEHVEQIGKNQIDIAYVGPVSFLAICDQFGPKPLLARLQRNGRAVLDGHIVVRWNSDIQSLGDLRGRSMGFGDPNSTMSSVVPLAVLKADGIDLDQLRSHTRYQGHTNIAFAVLSGQIDAGAVKSEVFERFREQGLRSLYRLPEVSEHLFLTRGDLEPTLIQRLRTLLLEAHESIQGLSALRALHSDATALVPVAAGDYRALRELLREGRSGD